MNTASENKGQSAEGHGEAAIILGGGLAGLAAGYRLTKAGLKASVFEAGPVVGGLSRTIRTGDFLFDLGGHRFFTTDKKVDALVRALMGEELIEVSRSSQIFLKEKFFDYPLKPLNAVSGLGISTVARIIADYSIERLKALVGNGRCVSMEDWVVKHFGRTMFNIYFKQYSEKVWGLGCDRISEKWVAKRIQGLSLWKALKNAFFKFSGREIPTLVDTFVYPRMGIGRISDRLKEEIERRNTVHTSTGVVGISRNGFKIESITVRNSGGEERIGAGELISTIPATSLVKMMEPAPPPDVMEAALKLRFRDLLLVAVMVGRERVTDQTWVYIPEKKIPFGRIHEPKNWSVDMAPADKTLLVIEYFCFKGDSTWTAPDEELSRVTCDGLEKLGFIRPGEVIGTEVVRVPGAYPLFEVGFEDNCKKVYGWLSGFKNLQVAGRSGTFQYHNMDHAIASGFEAAESLIKKRPGA